jgi:hypothetical protein
MEKAYPDDLTSEEIARVIYPEVEIIELQHP